MRALLQLFIRNGGFFTFAALELVCLYLMVNFDGERGGIYAHTSTLIGGEMNRQWHHVVQYWDSPDRLREVMRENDSLKTAPLRARTGRLARQTRSRPSAR